MAENTVGPLIELPDEGMPAVELRGMKDAMRRRLLTLEADRQGRLDQLGGILPKPANGNGKPDNASGSGANSAGAWHRTGRQPAPVLGKPQPVGSGTAATLPIPWLPTTRKQATEQCGGALAARAERLYKRGKVLAILDLPELAENTGNEDDEREGRTYVTVDVNLRRARVAKANDLKRQTDEAGIVFEGPGRGAPKRDGGQKTTPIHPPIDPLETIIADPGLCPARRLVAIAHVPFMDDSGVLDMNGGYNPKTGVFHDLAGLGPLTIPAQPTKADALVAVRVLIAPFVCYENCPLDGSEEAKAARLRWTGEVLTMQITAIERPFIEKAPLLIVGGNAAGVGKGEFCHAMTMLAYGSKGDIVTAGESEEEFDKRVDSVLIDGPPVVVIDNLNNHLLRNYALASIATEGKAKIRRFGRKGEDAHVEGRMLILVNGNNLFPSRDNNRRSFTVKLVTKNPQPAMRNFPFEPSVKVAETRLAMLEAAFTIMRWWRQQGMPLTSRPLGSFPEWRQRVASLVTDLTGWDPVASVEANAGNDRFSQRQAIAINALAARFGLGRIFRTSDVSRICDSVAKASRENGIYFVDDYKLSPHLHPSYWAAAKAHQAAEAARKAADIAHVFDSGGIGPEPAHLKALKDAEEAASDVFTAERTAAGRAQARLDTDVAEAIEAVTVGGSIKSQAIGNWFAAIEDSVIDDMMLVRDTTKAGAPEVCIVRV